MHQHEAHDLAALAERLFDARWTDPVPLMEQMDAHTDDVVEAAEVLIAGGDGETAAKLVGSLLGFWQTRGLVAKGRKVTDRCVELAGDAARTPEWGRVHLVAGVLAFRQGDQRLSLDATQRARTAAIATGDTVLEAEAETNLSRIAFRDSDADQMFRHASRVLELAADDLRLKTNAVHMLGWAEHTAGNIQAAVARFEENAALYHSLGDAIGEAMEYANLGDLALEQRDLVSARRYLRAAFDMPDTAANTYLIASMIRSAGVFAGLSGRSRNALVLMAASEATYESAGLTPDPGDVVTPAVRSEARSAIGPGAAEEATQLGVSMTLPGAIEAAIAVLAEAG